MTNMTYSLLPSLRGRPPIPSPRIQQVFGKLRLNAVYLNHRAEQLFANPEQYSSVTGLRGAFVTHEVNIFFFAFIREFRKFAQGGGITHYFFSKPLFIVYFFKRFVVRLGGIPATLLLEFFEKLF